MVVKKKITKKKIVKKVSKVKPRKLVLRNNKQIAMDFATKVHKKFDSVVKATILFGSEAKNEAKSTSDIDVIIVIDDVAINWDLELVAWYREELGKIVNASRYSKDLHINTIKLSTWWNDLLHGEPVVINVLRYGEALIDLGGFFNPLKALLLQGKIRSTPEAVYASLQRAPSHLARSKAAEIGAIEGIYWTMVDSAQAMLMTLGKLPPSPEHITKMLKENFVDKKLMSMELVTWYRDIYSLHKSISHGEISEVRGIEIDKWHDRAEKFLSITTKIIDKILETRK